MYCGQSKPFEVQFLHVCFAFLVSLRFFFITAQFKQHFQFSFLSAFPEVFPVVCLSARFLGFDPRPCASHCTFPIKSDWFLFEILSVSVFN